MIIRRCSSSNSDALSQEKEDHPDLNLGLLAAMTTIYTIAEGAVTYPYDLVKTRQQMTQGSGMAAGSAPARTHLSTGAHLMRIRHEGGVRALYRGFGWNLMGAIPSEVVYYVGYTQVKQALLLTPTGQAQLATSCPRRSRVPVSIHCGRPITCKDGGQAPRVLLSILSEYCVTPYPANCRGSSASAHFGAHGLRRPGSLHAAPWATPPAAGAVRYPGIPRGSRQQNPRARSCRSRGAGASV